MTVFYSKNRQILFKNTSLRSTNAGVRGVAHSTFLVAIMLEKAATDKNGESTSRKEAILGHQRSLPKSAPFNRYPTHWHINHSHPHHQNISCLLVPQSQMIQANDGCSNTFSFNYKYKTQMKGNCWFSNVLIKKIWQNGCNLMQVNINKRIEYGICWLQLVNSYSPLHFIFFLSRLDTLHNLKTKCGLYVGNKHYVV